VLTAMYSVLGVGLALSYVPQAIAAWRDRGSAESLLLAAWSFWTCHGAVARSVFFTPPPSSATRCS
jgi:hypothetical protein